MTRTSEQPELERVFREHHQDLVDGDYQAAWDLLSTRKQNKYDREDGFDGWITNQESLEPYIDTSATVSVRSINKSTLVATIYVSGAGCFSGITWMKYEDGSWHYDPGYSTTPQRERQWKPRYSDLLATSCL